MGLGHELRAQITASVANGFEEQIADTQQLMRLKSMRGDEQRHGGGAALPCGAASR